MHSTRLSRRRLLAAGLALPAVCGGAIAQAQAQNAAWPTRPIRLVIAFPPGGSSDITARLVAERLAPRLGQPVVAENRPGGGAMIAAEAVARAQPDGHTILFASSTVVISATTMANPAISLTRDLAPINNLVEAPMLLVASREAPFSTLEEMIRHARANPGKLNLGVPGAGSSNHLGLLLFVRQAGINVEIIPYPGNAPQLTALLRGDVHAVTDSIATSMPFLEDGKLRPLAVTAARRSAMLPNVPTIAEAARLPDYATSFWFGLMAPKATPAGVLARLERETSAVMAEPDVLERIRSQAFEPVAFGAEQFGQRIASDLELWGNVAREAGLAGR